jgi:hypothetical protein
LNGVGPGKIAPAFQKMHEEHRIQFLSKQKEYPDGESLDTNLKNHARLKMGLLKDLQDTQHKPLFQVDLKRANNHKRNKT